MQAELRVHLNDPSAIGKSQFLNCMNLP